MTSPEVDAINWLNTGRNTIPGYATEGTPIFDRLAEEWLTGERPLPDVCGALVRVGEGAQEALSRAALDPSPSKPGKPATAKRRQPHHTSRADRKRRKG